MAKYQKNFKKITPFRYPHKKHQRTETPPQYSNYRDYKLSLKKEFKNKCVYCRKSDALEDIGGFHVEHYLPKDQFKDLITEYNNLYYSCAACNRFKGNYWSNDEKRAIVNPCDYIMSHHLTFDKYEIVSLSESGKKTLEILCLQQIYEPTFFRTYVET